MASEKGPGQRLVSNLPFILVLAIGIAVGLTGILMAFVLCVWHITELSGWRYTISWMPFSEGNYLAAVQDLPRELYNCVMYFSEASFATLIFYPLAVTALAFYEAVHWEFRIILFGWLPFLVGFAISLASAVMIEREQSS